MTTLDLWLHGTRAAVVEPSGRAGIALTWSDEARARWGRGSRVLSHLLPLGLPEGEQHQRVRAWLEGLLPEGRARSTLAAERRIDPDDTLAFLAAYGADTAGAAVFLPAGSSTAGPAGSRSLDDGDVAQMLRAAEGRAGGRSRLDSLGSLAGMEPKIALTRTAAGWVMPTAAAPSTHILKLSRPAESRTADLIDTEAAALDLGRRTGVTTVRADVAVFDDVRALVVERYDRVVDGRDVRRTHQEDFAQALGIATADPERKFQRGRPLPSYAAMARVLADDGSTLDALARHVTFTVLIGDTDAHVKNHALVRREDGTGAVLAPAYDTAMHLHSRASSDRLALEVAGEDRFDAVDLDDVVAEVVGWKVPARRARRAVDEAADRFAQALGDIDRDAHPGVPRTAWQVVETRLSALRVRPG